MREQIKKNVLSKLQIHSRRDWVIFWVFAAMIAYAVGYRYEIRITYWLRNIGNPWLWEGNEPQSYGRSILAVVILAVVAEIVCFLRHKNWRTKLAVLAAGVLLPAILTGMYLINCRLIVSVLWEEDPSMTLWWERQEESIHYTPSEEEQEKLLEYCRNMTVVSDKQVQEEFMQWYRDTKGADFWSSTQLDLRFPEKYGHNYALKVQVWGDYLYFFRGYSDNILVTLFEDNGLIEYLAELEQEQAIFAE